MLWATARLRSTTGDGMTVAQPVVERRDPPPVGLLRLARPRVAGRERGLQRVGRRSAPPSASARLRAARPRRIKSWSQRARFCSVRGIGEPSGPGAGGEARGLDFHQREEAEHLGLVGHQAGEDAAEALRLGAQGRADQVLAGGGRIALVEDQVDDLQHRGEARVPLLAARHLEGEAGLARASSWRARCAGRWSLRSTGRRGRSRRWSARRSGAGSAPRAPRPTGPDGRR